MSRRGNIYDKSAPSRRPGSLARELVVLAARVRGVVLLALERVDDLVVACRFPMWRKNRFGART